MRKPNKAERRSGMAALPAVLVLVLVLLALLVSLGEAASFDGSRGGSRLQVARQRGGSMSRLWTESVLGRTYDDWKLDPASGPASKEALQNFTRAVSIGWYLDLSFVDAVYLPVPTNFIFVGFDGGGNQEFAMGEEELERWFTNMDHILEHTRVPQLEEELTPFYRAKGSRDQQHDLPLISHVHYNYSVHGIELNSKTNAVFERAIRLLARKEDAWGGEEAGRQWQVDVGGMSHIFQSLVNYLQLENAYNVFVLNPKRDPSHESYGYRHGLSAAEIRFLRENPEKRAALLKSRARVPDYLGEVEHIKKPLYERHPLVRFSWTTADEDHTTTWVTAIHSALDSLETALRLKSDEELSLWTAEQILNRERGEQAESALRRVLNPNRNNGEHAASALRRALNPKEEMGLHPECLVDAWVGPERWSFLDLSAGPFAWGPAVGGDGVRSEQSVPSVDASFANVSLPHAEVDSDAVQDDFQNLWRTRFLYLEEEERHTVDLLLAEVDVYEMFSHMHCTGRRIALEFCTEFQKRLADVRGELEAIHGEPAGEGDGGAQTTTKMTTAVQKEKAAQLLKRLDEGNIFNLAHEHTGNFSVARDSFLAHLGSVLSSAMKHVVTPSTADGAFHFYETLAFEIYFITQDKLKDDRLLPVDRDALKAALSTLVVSTQKAVFGLHTLALSEDPALAMAFTSAKRATIMPMLLVNGTYKSADRVYLDSLILQHHIKQLKFPTREKRSSPRSTLEVPIFWFLRYSGEPLLVDKHYLARALSDMVVVVQSAQHSWESHLQCNGESIRWDLRQPVAAAVAATAEHIAGLLPSHISFSAAHEDAVQDWLWSVGSHPLSGTSPGTLFSQFHNDAMARNYVVTALDESIGVINAGVRLLSNERTQAAGFSTFRSREQTLRYTFNRVVSLWKQIAGFCEELRYGEALKLLSYLETSSQSFYSTANETVAALHPVYCTRTHKLETRMDILAGLCLLLVLVVLRLVMRPRRAKPKIN